MAKTRNLHLELTTDDNTKFKDWRKAINGSGTGTTEDPYSNAQLIDEAIGELQGAAIFEAGSGTSSIKTKNTNCVADGDYSVAVGYSSQAEANYSHVEGFTTKVPSDSEHDARYGHAEGYLTEAAGLASHAEGDTTYTQNTAEHAQGRGNLSHKDSNNFGSAGNTIHSIGIASNNQDLTTNKNAVEIMQNGDQYIFGVGGYDGRNIDSATTVQATINGMSDNLAQAMQIFMASHNFDDVTPEELEDLITDGSDENPEEPEIITL